MSLLIPLTISLALYSSLRYFDVWSTQLCMTSLDLEMHEANPLIALLSKKIGFKQTMILTWVIFAVPIGLVDSFIVYPIMGIPFVWLFFGLFHIMAAANNYQIYSQMKIFGAESIRKSTIQVVEILKGLRWWRKVSFLVKTNFQYLFFSLYGLIALVLIFMLFSSINITFTRSIPALLAVGAPIMILDLVLYFPTMVFLSWMLVLRRLRVVKKKDIQTDDGRDYLTISVDVLETALREARSHNVETIQFLIPETQGATFNEKTRQEKEVK